VSNRGRFVETFYTASRREHLRQHDRMTKADKAVQERVNAFHKGGDRSAVPILSRPVVRRSRSRNQFVGDAGCR
jgi:hypothetical protein